MDVIEPLLIVLLRAAQAAALAMPTLLAGMLTAGLLRAIGGDAVRAWLSRGTWGDLPRAAGLALLLPVCAIGVLPVLVVLRSQGVRAASIVIVALAGPLVTPWTIGYLADVAGPAGLAMVVGGNLLVAILTAIALERLAPPRAAPPGVDGDAMGAMAGSSLLDVLRAAGRSLTRGTVATMLIACAGVGLLAVMIPPNGIGDWLVERSAGHAILVGGIGLLSYASPEHAAMQAGQVLGASTMPGLVIPLIAVGVALNLGTLVAAARTYGGRATLGALLSLIAAVSVTALAVDRIAHRPGVEVEDTHAFEEYGRPFHLTDHPDGVAAGFALRFTRVVGVPSLAGAVGVLALLACRRLPDRRPAHGGVAVRRGLDARWVAVPAVAATVALTAYTYYPAPSVIQSEIRRLAAEHDIAARSGDAPTVEAAAGQLRRRLGQITVASALRGRWLDAAQQRDVSAAIERVDQSLAALPTVPGAPATPGGPVTTYGAVVRLKLD